MTETDQPQPQPQPVNSIVATDHAIHIRLGRLALMIRGINGPDSETVVIDEALYLPLYEVLAREIATRISTLENTTTGLRVQQNNQTDFNADANKAIAEFSAAVAAIRRDLDRAAPPELASLVELVTGQQDQIDKLQAMLEPRIPAGVVDGRPVAVPEIGIALDGEIARAIDRHDLATRTHVDEAVRRLAATIRQYVRDQVQQALRRRPSALRRVWDALADRGAPSAPAPAQEPAAVPPAIAELAEQALRRGR